MSAYCWPIEEPDRTSSGAPGSPLHVALNCYALTDSSGGIGTYSLELVRNILDVEPETRFTLFTTRDGSALLRSQGWGEDVEIVETRGSVSYLSPREVANAAIAQWVDQPRKGARLGAEVLHGLAYASPPLARIPTVVTVHDLIWHHFPGSMSRANSVATRVLTEVSTRRADRIIAMSNAARDDISSTLGVDPARIDVTGAFPAPVADSGVPVDDVRGRLGLGAGPIALCVAQKRSHKNLLSLVEALALLDDPPVALVIPGAPTPYEIEIRERARKLGVEDRVHLPGWVTQEELESLYAEAKVFVLPSLMEGYGLPVIEAMSRGVPVACSDVSSLPEVAGEAALLFDPNDPKSIAEAIRKIVGDETLAQDLRARGRARSDELSGADAAEKTLASYRRATSAESAS